MNLEQDGKREMNWDSIWHNFLTYLCGSFFLFEILEHFSGFYAALGISLLRLFLWESWNVINSSKIDAEDILYSLLGVFLAFLI
jgi:hypothetical protein